MICGKGEWSILSSNISETLHETECAGQLLFGVIGAQPNIECIDKNLFFPPVQCPSEGRVTHVDCHPNISFSSSSSYSVQIKSSLSLKDLVFNFNVKLDHQCLDTAVVHLELQIPKYSNKSLRVSDRGGHQQWQVGWMTSTDLKLDLWSKGVKDHTFLKNRRQRSCPLPQSLSIVVDFDV